jgi:hypothetical protein
MKANPLSKFRQQVLSSTSNTVRSKAELSASVDLCQWIAQTTELAVFITLGVHGESVVLRQLLRSNISANSVGVLSICSANPSCLSLANASRQSRS